MTTTTDLKIANLRQLLDFDARRFTSAEIHLHRALPGWIKAATSLKLQAVLQRYADYVAVHVVNMEKFIAAEEIYSISLHNQVIEAFIAETDEKLAASCDEEVKDAALLACVQAINHYKISTYGSAAAFAQTLHFDNAATIFKEAEMQEKQIDDRLSQLAAFEINRLANEPAG